MSDSDSNFPPADDTPRRKRPDSRDEADDDFVDLSHYEPADEGSAVLSHSGRLSGPISGSSIVSWDELARAHGPSEGEDFIVVDDQNGIDFDAASDIDLLHKVLSNDPPPSAIILKDPSSPDTPALPHDDEPYDAAESALEGFDDPDGPPSSKASSRRLPRVAPSRPPSDAEAFTLPPELASHTKVDAPPEHDEDDEFRHPAAAGGTGTSSILDDAPIGSGHSGISSDVWADSSRVDLLATPKPLEFSSESLGHTDGVDASSSVSFPRPGDSATLLGDSPDSDIESSAVDLGSQAAIDLPFPLGLDSSVGSSTTQTSKSKPSGSQSSDSGTVDLLAGSGEFDLGTVTGMSSVVRQLRTERDDLPPTTPLNAPRAGRAGAWLGGSLIGLAAGVVAAAGIWYLGYIPPSEQYASLAAPLKKPLPAPAAATAAALTAAEDKANKLTVELKALTDKAKAATADAARAKAELDRLRTKLDAAKLNPADLGGVAQRLAGADEAIARARTANQTLAELLDKLKAAELDPANLDASLKSLKEARSKAEVALKDSTAEAARLREQSERAVASAREAQEKLQAQSAGLSASQAQLVEVASQVTAKLQAAKLVGSKPQPGELLAAVDRALQARPAVPRSVLATPVPAAPPPPSADADSLLAAGLKAVTTRDYAGAIRSLTASANANPRDARAYYLLGVARMQTGESAAAYQLFNAARKVELLGETDTTELMATLRQLTPTEQNILGRYRE